MKLFSGTSWKGSKPLAIVSIVIVAAVAICGVAFATNGFSLLSSAETLKPSSQYDNENKASVKSATDLQPKNVAEEESTPNSQPSQPSTNTSIQENSLSTRPTVLAPTPATPPTPTTSSQGSTQTQVATCNEAMKASYMNLYNAQIAAENTRWDNQQDAIRSDAQRRGIGFSGIVQEQIDAARPAHEANLAAIETSYMQNLSSINCL